MGTTTPNIGLYIPADGETNYGTAFANGMLNLDTHDHSGPPNKGVPLSSSGLADGSVTAIKLNDDVISPGGGLSFDVNHAIQTDGVLNSIYKLGSNGIIVRTSSTTATTRTIVSADTSQIVVTNGDGVAGNPTLSFPASSNTWTPSLKFGGATTGIVGTQSGRYVRMGSLVFIQYKIELTSKGSATGAATIDGLPFSSLAIVNTGCTSPPGIWLNLTLTTNFTMPNAHIQAGSSSIFLQQQGSGQPLTALSDTNFSNTTLIQGFLWYFVS